MATSDKVERVTSGRRAFLKNAAAGLGASALPAAAAAAEPGPDKNGAKERPHPGDIVIERPGSDFMVDVIKSLDLEFVTTNPGSSLRSLHESIVNYGGNRHLPAADIEISRRSR